MNEKVINIHAYTFDIPMHDGGFVHVKIFEALRNVMRLGSIQWPDPRTIGIPHQRHSICFRISLQILDDSSLFRPR
jgi:hypothetical protein